MGSKNSKLKNTKCDLTNLRFNNGKYSIKYENRSPVLDDKGNFVFVDNEKEMYKCSNLKSQEDIINCKRLRQKGLWAIQRYDCSKAGSKKEIENCERVKQSGLYDIHKTHDDKKSPGIIATIKSDWTKDDSIMEKKIKDKLRDINSEKFLCGTECKNDFNEDCQNCINKCNFCKECGNEKITKNNICKYYKCITKNPNCRISSQAMNAKGIVNYLNSSDVNCIKSDCENYGCGLWNDGKISNKCGSTNRGKYSFTDVLGEQIGSSYDEGLLLV